jgi:hypothetical protein
MITIDTKLFVQLKPTEESIDQLVALQNTYFPNATHIKVAALHVTILHIGEAGRIFDEINAINSVSEPLFLEYVTNFAKQLQSMVDEHGAATVQLRPVGISVIGNTTTQVLFLLPSDELRALHQRSIEIFKEFLQKCGIEDYNYFTYKSIALAHSDKLLPHVSLVKHVEQDTKIAAKLPNALQFSLDVVAHEK